MQEYLEFATRHPFLMGAVSAVVIMILVTETRRATRRWSDVSVPQAVQLMNRDGAMVVDVRENVGQGDSRIPKARHMKQAQLAERAADLAAPVIVYCQNGVQSQRACRLLARAGVTPVYNLKGGISSWRDAGMPLETS